MTFCPVGNETVYKRRQGTLLGCALYNFSFPELVIGPLCSMSCCVGIFHCFIMSFCNASNLYSVLPEAISAVSWFFQIKLSKTEVV